MQQERRLIELVVGDREQQEVVQGKLALLAKQRKGLSEQLQAAEEGVARHNSLSRLKDIEALCAQALGHLVGPLCPSLCPSRALSRLRPANGS